MLFEGPLPLEAVPLLPLAMMKKGLAELQCSAENHVLLPLLPMPVLPHAHEQ